jgi:hypothetical protein
MEKIIKKDNQTMYYIDDDLLLTITDLNDNHFIVQNNSTKIEGKLYIVDEFITEIQIMNHKRKDTIGRWRKNTKLLEHNTKWFSYILQDRGFIRKAKCVLDKQYEN